MPSASGWRSSTSSAAAWGAESISPTVSLCPRQSPKRQKNRLEILNHSNDGFFIAGEDLRLRGPGDLFGIRQSGILDFKIADVFQDAKVLKSAAEEAGKILEDDPELERPVHAGLKKHIDSRIQEIMLEATL